MFYAKFEQGVYKLRFAAWFLRNFQTAQGGELDVDVAHFTRTLADSLQHFQKLLLIAVAIGKNLFQQGLKPATRSTEGMDACSVLSRGKFHQCSLRLLKHEPATFGC